MSVCVKNTSRLIFVQCVHGLKNISAILGDAIGTNTFLSRGLFFGPFRSSFI